MTRLVTEVLRQYDERFPGAKEARTRDQWSYYSRTLLGQMLAAADWALEAEDIDERVRYRVLVAMALGETSPLDAELRMQREAEVLRMFETQAVPRVIVVPAERFEEMHPQASPEPAPGTPARGALRRNSVTKKHLKEVAAVYRRAVDDGLPPTRAVADHFDASHSTAARWVSMARAPENAFLGPASRGRSGEGERDG